jgi:hypothetical protein
VLTRTPRQFDVSRLQNTPEAFQSQLLEGQYNELRVALYFMLEGCPVRIGFRQGHYDLEVLGQGGTRHVEVKWDRRASRSGNLYFEVENTRQRRPSGVMATGADLWCHVLGEGARALLIGVPRLREFLGRGRFRSVNTGGADSNSRGLLVPLAEALRCADFREIRLPTVEEYFGEIHRRALSE